MKLNTPDPPVRVDRFYFQELELYLAEELLKIAAVMVNEIGRGGTIYPNVILPPEEQMMKEQAQSRAFGGQ